MPRFAPCPPARSMRPARRPGLDGGPPRAWPHSVSTSGNTGGMGADLTAETVELLQQLIRNQCVNDGTPASGEETRNADVLQQVVAVPGVTIERWEPVPGRASFVARLEGRDPKAPRLCLMGHTDVVPVHPEGWREDPFGGDRLPGP